MELKEKRVVTIPLNFHMGGFVQTVEGKIKSWRKENIAYPVIIKHYNLNMSGKWWRRILSYFVQVTISNDYVTYTGRCVEKNLDQKTFRHFVVAELT